MGRSQASGSTHPSEYRRSDNLSSLAPTIQQSVRTPSNASYSLGTDSSVSRILLGFAPLGPDPPTHNFKRPPPAHPQLPKLRRPGAPCPSSTEWNPSVQCCPRTFRPTSSVAKDNGERRT
ncbi:hypothetical protein CFIO01_06559 [Colletotrichum fioriniae PJ7]|uniref:Uncharacterized protein n=1 Tax=Colletotrichum fioriniae PJ7 TaxID=1445577 RepID=A0A010S8G3_9PEZI|nr:hypothetical protein CFIO01_06559 [Colletotrichum fioriniae PJ7]